MSTNLHYYSHFTQTSQKPERVIIFLAKKATKTTEPQILNLNTEHVLGWVGITHEHMLRWVSCMNTCYFALQPKSNRLEKAASPILHVSSCKTVFYRTIPHKKNTGVAIWPNKEDTHDSVYIPFPSPKSSFPPTHTLRGNSDGSENWVSDTHLEAWMESLALCRGKDVHGYKRQWEYPSGSQTICILIALMLRSWLCYCIIIFQICHLEKLNKGDMQLSDSVLTTAHKPIIEKIK